MLRKLLKVLNPFIWLINLMLHGGHMDMYRDSKEYDPYNFDNDIKYF